MTKKSDRRRRAKRAESHLERVNLFAAGIDIGSRSHFVAVAEDLDEQPVREFACFTGDLHRMADWLVELGIETVAMESTGVYWIPAYEILEARGLEVLLVDARHVKNVPGRKSDVLDCQWLQQLHTYGLLRGAFRPPEEMVVLRAYLRQRDGLIRSRSDCVRHMQKALRQMNLLLDNVVSDITGATGMGIIRAILAGERDARVLAQLRDRRCRADQRTIAGSLEGHYREEHLFALGQAVECYDFYHRQIEACEQAIERHLQRMDSDGEGGGSGEPPPPSKPAGHSKNGLSFDARSHLYRLIGVDLTAINGMSESSALAFLAETGSDMSAWPSEKHFASWLGLSPGSKVSGGKRLSGKSKPVANRAAEVLRLAAYSLANSHCALGAYYRRLRARLGAPKANTATAHKLARIIYRMLKHRTPFVDPGQDYYEQQYRERVTRNLTRRARAMGLQLVPISDSENQESMA
ncbi:IS110 family transposase [Alkalilimnicola ehrlichii]|uniref:IS110 family transposase n=1 Tax=Alkalilimnicola ehrlichii TaxID=351052 RepID=UPI003BA125FC